MIHLIEQLEIPICPHCRINSPNIILQQYHNTIAKMDNRKHFWGVYACQRCGAIVSAEAATSGGEVIGVYPSVKSINDNIPPKAKTFLEQAEATRHAPVAAVLVSGSAVDEMLKVKGYINGSLYSRIEKAAKDHLVTEEMATWAHEIRLDANDQRHADVNADLPTDADAEKCIEFAKALAEYLFVLPARVQRGIAKTTT